MPEPPKTHEEFAQAIQNHLKAREGCAIILIVHTQLGLEMQFNFLDYALQEGILNIARETVLAAYRRQIEETLKNGVQQMMVSNIQDAMDPNKKKVN
jgi:hypothetical protein